jgi:hypothetical protein
MAAAWVSASPEVRLVGPRPGERRRRTPRGRYSARRSPTLRRTCWRGCRSAAAGTWFLPQRSSRACSARVPSGSAWSPQCGSRGRIATGTDATTSAGFPHARRTGPSRRPAVQPAYLHIVAMRGITRSCRMSSAFGQSLLCLPATPCGRPGCGCSRRALMDQPGPRAVVRVVCVPLPGHEPGQDRGLRRRSDRISPLQPAQALRLRHGSELRRIGGG